ncbi:hypothetical protein [Pontibacter sp. G13]|uniref:hypothetical protein n=1 Tax=Pontibacter sp. G13 TaxID=3074898 RepID=UPI00288B28D4|nr:hypothetical protein [Pontibacter sp. G13]WNJ18509.1 hypothetical protein RJD25_26945 [Pontibacter sp. G13]
MQTQEIISYTVELEAAMKKAAEIAEKLRNGLPEMEEPAMRAQASVICAFLHQTEQYQTRLTQMLSAKTA